MLHAGLLLSHPEGESVLEIPLPLETMSLVEYGKSCNLNHTLKSIQNVELPSMESRTEYMTLDGFNRSRGPLE